VSLPGRHWLGGVRHLASPNADERPDPGLVDLLVIHGISLPPGVFGGRFIDDLFLNRLDPEADPYFATIVDLRVSAHLLIRRDGGTTQFVALDRRAWHAGKSQFCGRERCNDYAVGIELEGADGIAFSDVQYGRLATITAQIMQIYPLITPDRIVGHADIAPGRKTDPGAGFDWAVYARRLAEVLEEIPGHGRFT
jgi:AmpD protein